MMFTGDSNGVLCLWQTRAEKKKKDGWFFFVIFIQWNLNCKIPYFKHFKCRPSVSLVDLLEGRVLDKEAWVAANFLDTPWSPGLKKSSFQEEILILAGKGLKYD